MISYAQNFEDVMLARALGDRPHGFYIDVGACFPDIASVTRHFYDLGWTGVNVEPMEAPFERLRAERVRDINLRAAAASYNGEITIYRGESVGESSAVRPFAEAPAVVVPCFTLAEICRLHASQPVDFLKIDVEGLEADVVKGGDWATYRPAVLVIEVTMPWSTQRRPDAVDIADYLRARNYDEVYFDGLNAFYLAREAAALTSRFNVPPNVLDNITTMREWSLEQTSAALETSVAEAAQRLAGTEALLHTAQATVDRVQAALDFAVREASSASASARQAHAELEVQVERFAQHSAALTQRAETAEREMQAQIERAAQHSAALTQRAETAEREGHLAMDKLRAADGRIQTLEWLNQVSEARASRAEQALASVLASRTWRATAPARAAADWVKGALKRQSDAPAAPRATGLVSVRGNALRRAGMLARRTSFYHWAMPRFKHHFPNAWLRVKKMVLESSAVPIDKSTVPVPPGQGTAAVEVAGSPAPSSSADAMAAGRSVDELLSRIHREIAQRRAS